MSQDMIRLHAMIQQFRALGAWGIAEMMERVLRGDLS